MTGAVLERYLEQDAYDLLRPNELRGLCHEYNELLNSGFRKGFATTYEYERNDCVFIDNLAVAHRAAPEAHKPASEQGLRIMHRSTVRGTGLLTPRHGLPPQLDIYGPNPTSGGLWQAGGIGFRCEDGIPMRN